MLWRKHSAIKNIGMCIAVRKFPFDRAPTDQLPIKTGFINFRKVNYHVVPSIFSKSYRVVTCRSSIKTSFILPGQLQILRLVVVISNNLLDVWAINDILDSLLRDIWHASVEKSRKILHIKKNIISYTNQQEGKNHPLAPNSLAPGKQDQ